jgi:hypothetical protein
VVSPETAEAREAQIARLEGRIAALERALVRRSRQIRLLQRYLGSRDLLALGRIAADLPALPRIASQPEYWRETTALLSVGVVETLEDLWQTELPPEPAPGGPADGGA